MYTDTLPKSIGNHQQLTTYISANLTPNSTWLLSVMTSHCTQFVKEFKLEEKLQSRLGECCSPNLCNHIHVVSLTLWFTTLNLFSVMHILCGASVSLGQEN